MKRSKPRLFWCPRTQRWIYYTSWVRGSRDTIAERFCAALNAGRLT
jgi:hypothetical protein